MLRKFQPNPSFIVDGNNLLREGNKIHGGTCLEGTFKSGVQVALFIITHVLGVTATIMTFFWIASYSGFHWDGTAKFNWHPTLMVLGPVYLLGIALSTHRLWPGNEKTQKLLHLIFMVIMFVCLIIAFAIVVDLANGLNFLTLHGWLGLIFTIIMLIEVPVFLIVYGFNVSKDAQNKLKKWHIKSAIAVLLLSLAATLTGFQSHLVTESYNEKTVINLVGLLIFAFITIITYVLIEDGSGD